MIFKNKLINGVGINDAGYLVQSKVGGSSTWCHFYRTWSDMIKRCYNKKYQVAKPAYIGCTVRDEWLTFSSFKAWMETQDWQGKQLDKDIINPGNKIYSPENCVFVDSMTNNFILDRAAHRGLCPVGVVRQSGKFRARCSNNFTNKNEHLGYFTCPNQAHQAWKKRKHELACQLADLQSDKRVAEALRVRYA